MRPGLLAIAATALLAVTAGLARAEGRVELELVTEENFPALETQRWYRLFTDLKVAGLTIRAARAQDKPEVVARGKGEDAVYHVTGILTSRNELLVPGAKFSARDGARIAAWLERLAEEGPGGERVPRVFGLEPEELVRVREDLARPVALVTKGQDRLEVLTRLCKELSIPAGMEGGVEAALVESGPVTEELEGLASGTALAYILRPGGLGFAPRKTEAGGLEYVIFVADASRDRWPVGLPAEDQRDEVMPKLMEFLNVEIEDVTVQQVLDALGGRLEAPMLLDHVALADRQIDVAKTKVSLPGKRTTYSLALRKLLGQARLKSELRVDDAGKPFFWVTTLIQPR
jgi:hypothetical protein